MRTVKVLTSVLATALLLPACSIASGEQEAAPPTAASGARIVTVGTLPVIEYAPLYLAESQGYFKAEGITVKTQLTPNAAAIVPAVMNGQLQIGESAVFAYVNAKARNLPVTGLASAATTNKDEATDFSGIFVKDATIKSPKDLEGKKVGVNALGAAMQVTAAKSVKLAGGDPKKVSFVAMPFPDMPAALKRGDLDAVVVVEPFYSVMAGAGMTNIDHMYLTALAKGSTIGMYFTSTEWASKNADVAGAFQRAIKKAGAYAAEHPEAVREVAVKELGIDAQVAEKMRLPEFGGELTAEHLTSVAATMLDLGFIDKAPAEDGLVWQP